MSMSTTLQRVTVRIICRSCRHPWELCVPVEVAVPGPLRCTPAGGPAPGAGTKAGLRCPKCDCPCDLTEAELRRRVEDELRTGRGRHVPTGAVVIDCR